MVFNLLCRSSPRYLPLSVCVCVCVAQLLDILATAVGRININTQVRPHRSHRLHRPLSTPKSSLTPAPPPPTQCGRSPDTVPFSGRRSSALGTMSVSEALRAFSVEVTHHLRRFLCTLPTLISLSPVRHHSISLLPVIATGGGGGEVQPRQRRHPRAAGRPRGVPRAARAPLKSATGWLAGSLPP